MTHLTAPGAEGGNIVCDSNDPLFGEQREFGQMQVLEALVYHARQPESVLIGVVERGFDATHEVVPGRSNQRASTWPG
jgi:hypothetical protein